MKDEDRFDAFQRILEDLHQISSHPNVQAQLPEVLERFQFLISKRIITPKDYDKDYENAELNAQYDDPDNELLELEICLFNNEDAQHSLEWEKACNQVMYTAYDYQNHIILIRVPYLESPRYVSCCLLHEAARAMRMEETVLAENCNPTLTERIEEEIPTYTTEIQIFRAMAGERYVQLLHKKALQRIYSNFTIEVVYDDYFDSLLGQLPAISIGRKDREVMFNIHVDFTASELCALTAEEQNKFKSSIILEQSLRRS